MTYTAYRYRHCYAGWCMDARMRCGGAPTKAIPHLFGILCIPKQEVLPCRGPVRFTWAFQENLETHVCIEDSLQLCTGY